MTSDPGDEPEAGTAPSGHLVVGFDGSESSATALRWATREAVRRRAGLRVVQAFDLPVGYLSPGSLESPELFDQLRGSVEESLHRAQELVQADEPGLAVEISAVPATPLAALQSASEGAALTVVGSHGTSQIGEALLGSVAVRVASRLVNPVAVVHTDPLALPTENFTDENGPVIVGLDGSSGSSEALDFALEEASVRDVDLHAVYAWDDDALAVLVRSLLGTIDTAAMDEQALRVLEDQLAGELDRRPGVRVHRRIEHGRPSSALLRCCAQLRPSVLVVGSRGRGGFTGLLLGSTSNELIAYAPCPVVVAGADRE